MARVFIGIGSNEGDRLVNISRAIQQLASSPDIHVVQLATIYETKPVGGLPQPEFLNTVVELETSHGPHELLDIVKRIERQLGRVPTAQQWGPRVIDLDILLYGDRIMREPNLVIPHARLHERRFVLEPLAQLAPALTHPVLGQTIAQLLNRLPEPSLT